VVEFFLGCAARRRGAMRQPRPGCRTITQADQHDPGGSLKSPGHANRLIMRTSRSYPPRNATAIIAFSRSYNSPNATLDCPDVRTLRRTQYRPRPATPNLRGRFRRSRLVQALRRLYDIRYMMECVARLFHADNGYRLRFDPADAVRPVAAVAGVRCTRRV
jgi:hypothetical protein